LSLPRTFVGFSSTDLHSYHLMCAWKAHEHIDFNFADFQLNDAIDSRNEQYIKRVCSSKIRLSDTYVLLIGQDTSARTTYVKWEVEVAMQTGCRLIGVNLNNSRSRDRLCPPFFANRGALFVPYSPRIIAKALEPWQHSPRQSQDWHFEDSVYSALGYQLVGDTAVLPPSKPLSLGSLFSKK
jgi:hypothetical protein